MKIVIKADGALGATFDMVNILYEDGVRDEIYIKSWDTENINDLLNYVIKSLTDGPVGTRVWKLLAAIGDFIDTS